MTTESMPGVLRPSDGLGPLPKPDVPLVRGGCYTEALVHKIVAEKVAAERKPNAAWFALVMNAAAALEDAANCLRDPDAKRACAGAARHYRTAANAMWAECVGPNVI